MSDTKRHYKYRCLEVGCRSVVDDKKWLRHCKTKHAFKTSRHLPLNREIIEIRVGKGPWKTYNKQSGTDVKQAQNKVGSEAMEALEKNVLVISTDEEGERSEGECSDTLNIVGAAVNFSKATVKSVLDNFEPHIEILETNDNPEVTISSSNEPEFECSATFNIVGGAMNFLKATEKSDSKNVDTTEELQDPITICNSNDPVQFVGVRITAHVINRIIQTGSFNLSHVTAAKDGNLRCFQPSWFFRELHDGSKNKRTWLSFSKSTSCLFCLDCIAFGGPKASETWTKFGFDQLQHATRDIALHETSSQHRDAEVAKYRWTSNKTIDIFFNNKRSGWNEEVAKNRRVMHVQLEAVKYLAKGMMAFRGHEQYEGNLFNLFSLLAKFDSAAAAYLQGLETKSGKMECNLISPGNQKRLLTTLKIMIQEKIMDNINAQAVFSFIFDGTYDVSKKEANAMIFRILEMKDGNTATIKERLFEVFTTGDTTAASLEKDIVSLCSHWNLDWTLMVSQSYDGASNMRGHISGLQALLAKRAPKAIYVWCHAHRLNLVVENMAAQCIPIRNALGILQEFYVFFNGHKRNEAFLKAQEQLPHKKTLKRVESTTRTWRSMEDATDVVLSRFDELCSALLQLCQDGDGSTVVGASGLLKQLKDINFIICLHIIQEVMHILGPASRMLQGSSVDLGAVVNIIQSSKARLSKLRENDTSWCSLWERGKSFAEKRSVEINMSDNRRKVRRVDKDIPSSEHIAFTTAEHLQINVYYHALDVLANDLKHRFDDDALSILKDIRTFTSGELLKENSDIKAENIHLFCTHYQFNEDKVIRELKDFSVVYQQCHHLIDMSDVLQPTLVRQMEIEDDEDLQMDSHWLRNTFYQPFRLLMQLSGFPMLTTVYKVLVTIAVTSASAERSMSKVRIVKTHLRSTMCDPYFSSLLVLASEKDILDSLSNEKVIDRMAALSPVLSKYLTFV